MPCLFSPGQELLEERQREKKQMAREFQKQMQIMQKEHKKEVDVSTVVKIGYILALPHHDSYLSY